MRDERGLSGQPVCRPVRGDSKCQADSCRREISGVVIKDLTLGAETARAARQRLRFDLAKVKVAAVLGIDAAWTPTRPSGVALAVNQGSRWGVSCVAPSYESFIACCGGQSVDWRSPKFAGSVPSVPELLTAATALTGLRVSLVAADIPVSTVPFPGRRAAYNAISAAFGGRGCSSHSPSTRRPGPLGEKLMSELRGAGYPLATAVEQTYGPAAGRRRRHAQRIEVARATPAWLSLHPHGAAAVSGAGDPGPGLGQRDAEVVGEVVRFSRSVGGEVAAGELGTGRLRLGR